MRSADAPLAAMGAQFVKHVQAHRLDENLINATTTNQDARPLDEFQFCHERKHLATLFNVEDTSIEPGQAFLLRSICGTEDPRFNMNNQVCKNTNEKTTAPQ